MLTHGNIAVHNRIVQSYYGYKDSDIHLLVLPVFHVNGIDIAMNPALAQGSTLIMLARFDLLTMLEVISRFKITHMVTSASINIAVNNFSDVSNYSFDSLRLVFSDGAPVPESVHKKWFKLTGTQLIEGYGLSESSGRIICNTRQKGTPGTVGRPVYYHDIKLVDTDQGTESGIGKPGELWIKGPCVMKGYWKASGQTESVLTADGWLKTGDIAIVNDDGGVKILGRLNERINVSGYPVFLAEIDRVLIAHEAIIEAASIGVPHPYRGEQAKSFVVLSEAYKGKITEDDIIDFCKKRMATYTYPRQIKFIDALPKSGAGKLLRRELKNDAN
jgi:long-chain acyl-CoA synthetase